MSTGGSRTGVSRRAYAEMRGVSEATIRKYLTAGKLNDALLPDDTLDPEKADELLGPLITSGNAQPIELGTAKARRLRVQVLRANDKLKELKRSLVLVEDAASELAAHNRLIAGHLRPLAERMAPIVAGMQAPAALLALRNAVHEVLEAISSDTSMDSTETDEEKETEELQLNGLTETELLAKRIDLQAEKLECERGLEVGELRRIYELVEEFEEKGAICKSLLRALPGRLAVHMEGATAAQAQVLIAAEIEQAISALE